MNEKLRDKYFSQELKLLKIGHYCKKGKVVIQDTYKKVLRDLKKEHSEYRGH